MAANNDSASTSNKLCLRHYGMEDETERGDRFWNTSSVEMKFSTGKEWLRRVRFAENKPNYGMRDLDPVLEELTGNKLELVGPLVDGFLKEIGLSINAKLARSRMTGLMAPITLFMPFQIFKHIWVLVQGYGGSADTTKNGERITLTFQRLDTAEKIWSPARFQGENFLKKRHFEKILEDGRVLQSYSGKSIVVVIQTTPLQMVYSTKQQRVVTIFCVQRYDREGFAKDSNLQKLLHLKTI